MSALLIDRDPAKAAALSGDRRALLALERRRSRLFRLWIVTGLFFMVLPGTILGFTKLLLTSAHHGFAGLALLTTILLAADFLRVPYPINPAFGRTASFRCAKTTSRWKPAASGITGLKLAAPV